MLEAFSDENGIKLLLGGDEMRALDESSSSSAASTKLDISLHFSEM
jgi:hypothetical protein